MMKTKRRIKKIRLFIFIIILAVVAIFLFSKGFYYLTTSKVERDLKKLNYSNEAIPLIIDKKLDEYLIEKNIYSKTLEIALTKSQYESKYLDEYIYFPYKEYDKYISQLNGLKKIGYERKDIEQIFNNLKENDIDIIIDKKDVINNLTNYIKDKYFVIDNLDRYLSYKKKHSTYGYDKIVLYVNMYLDYPHYDYAKDIKNPDDPLVIVNKYYKLGSNFVPKNLVKIDSKYTDKWDRLVIPVVKENFEKMASDMSKIGLEIRATSAYRSYDTQVTVYNDNVNQSGKAYADAISARAGYSEHQTGMAIDVKNGSSNYGLFKDSDEYDWMKENAHKYGFIMRYPESKTDITGYNFESWHYRYVGKDVAKYIYENDITFDEYYAMFIANKKD